MKAKDFLCEFEGASFPQSSGPLIGLDDHDPPWTQTQLKAMERQSLIEFNIERTGYRLTMKATRRRTALRIGVA